MTRRSLAALLLLALAGCGGGSSSKSASTVPVSGNEIDMTAKAFSFTPSTVTVKAGQPVTLVLKSTDIAHDFTVDDPKIHIAAGGGKTTRGTIDVSAPSTYTFYCSVAGHKAAGMVGKLVVEAG